MNGDTPRATPRATADVADLFLPVYATASARSRQSGRTLLLHLHFDGCTDHRGIAARPSESDLNLLITSQEGSGARMESEGPDLDYLSMYASGELSKRRTKRHRRNERPFCRADRQDLRRALRGK